MSKAQIVRKSFNGGEIAPELHYRSDLETYHNACKSLKNMTVTPWGAATRRPPTELLAKIDTAVYGVPVKYLPFRFSLTETFHIMFTDGSGSASADATTADFIVFDADGVLQTLDGASTKILTTVYDPADLGALHHIQVNDFIYMTCGGDYPVQALSRFFDEGQSANRWRVEEFDSNSGPFDEENEDKGILLTASYGEWDAAVTYGEGDYVIRQKNAKTVSGVKWSTSRTEVKTSARFGSIVYAVLEVTATAHGLSVGDSVTFTNLTATRKGDNSTDARWSNNSSVQINGDISGEYVVSSVIDANTVRFQREGRAAGFILGGSMSHFPTLSLSSSKLLVGVDGIYQSRFDENLNNALPVSGSSVNWRVSKFAASPINLTSNADVFQASDVGRLVKMRVEAQEERLSGSYTASAVSDAVPAIGTVELKTEGGTWSGTIELQESLDYGQTWKTLGKITSISGSSNGSFERDVMSAKTLVRVKFTLAEAGTCKWKLSLPGHFRYFRIFEFIDAKTVMAQPESPITGIHTDYRWSLGSFSETTGYPNTLTIHDERMVFGGTKRKPNTVWASRVNDWTNFLEGDTEVSPYTFTIKSDSFDTIRWMRSTRNLMIGTENSESTMGTRDDNSVISPTNIDVQTQTYFGSANIQAVVTADLVFFVQGQRRRVRSTQYDFGTDQYLSSEMSILAHHITKPGIKEMSFRRHPYSSIFFVLDDGRAVSFTYERDNQVKGWARMEFGGGAFIVSAASNYSDEGDIIGGIVKRGSEYTLETFGSFNSGTVYLDGQTQSDSGWSSGKALDYADTSGLAVVMDDALLVEGTDYSWTGSTLTIPDHSDETVTVGWPFAFEIEPTDIIELGDHGAQKRISKLGLYLLASGGCDIAVNGEDCPFQEGNSLAAGFRLNGEHQISVGGGTESAIQIKLSGDHHLPFNLSAFGVYGQPSR